MNEIDLSKTYYYKFDTLEEYEANKDNLEDHYVALVESDTSIHYWSTENINRFVDLGLPSGNLWAVANVGAKTETDYGKYFQWGDTVGYEGDEAAEHSNFKTQPMNGSRSGFCQSCLMCAQEDFFPHNILLPSKDAANQNMGGDWRMPTVNDLYELISETVTGWTTINDVYGVKFTKTDDEATYLFIPAAGYAYDGDMEGQATSISLLSSNFNLIEANDATVWELQIDKESELCDTQPTYFICAETVRGVKTKKCTIKFYEEDGTTLITSYTQEYKTEITAPDVKKQGYKLSWVPEFNPIVTEDKSYTASYTEYEYVDLGLPSGKLWAKTNIGADTETESGKYFQWGDIKGFIYPNKDEKYPSSWSTAPFNNGLSEYNKEYFTSVSGTVCPNNVLSLENDAAHELWGGDWRMPTKEDLKELFEETTTSLTTTNEVECLKFTNKTDETKYIVIPEALAIIDNSAINRRHDIWTSSLNEDKVLLGTAFLLLTEPNKEQKVFHYDWSSSRKEAHPIRPVKPKSQQETE